MVPLRIPELDYVASPLAVRSPPVDNQVVQDGDEVENDEEANEDYQKDRPLARALGVELLVDPRCRHDKEEAERNKPHFVHNVHDFDQSVFPLAVANDQQDHAKPRVHNQLNLPHSEIRAVDQECGEENSP